MDETVRKEAWVARKKQHLRYRAKKTHSQTESAGEVKAIQRDKSRAVQQDKKKVVKLEPQTIENQDFTRLPESETRFVRKEIIYIFFIALVLMLLYLAIFLIFRYTTADDWLNQLIGLKG